MSAGGLFVVFEGGDGVGKSTQVALLSVWLRSGPGGAHKVLATREPGGTPLGLALREAVMHGDHVNPRAEALIYAADRAHHVATVVRPALDRGEVVLQDRYLDSSIVYQGGARGLGEEVERISRWATEGLLPDLTILLDMEPAADRMARDLDRVEREMSGAAAQIRADFLALAARDPARYSVIDASETVEYVHREVREAVVQAMAQPRRATAPGPADDSVAVVPHAHRGHR